MLHEEEMNSRTQGNYAHDFIGLLSWNEKNAFSAGDFLCFIFLSRSSVLVSLLRRNTVSAVCDTFKNEKRYE